MKIKKNQESSIYRKVIFSFSLILIMVLFVVGAIINHFCMSFIKKQRLTYNAQVLGDVEYEFKELYTQMNQFLTSLYEVDYQEPLDDTTFQRIKMELEFETSIQNIVYLNGFNNFIEGVLFYESDKEVRYVGKGPLNEDYRFSLEERFFGKAGQLSACQVVGPMWEPYKPVHVKKNGVVGFMKRKSGVQKETMLPPFVMAAVKFDKVEEMLKKLLAANTGYFLMNEQGNILHSSDLTKLNWKAATLTEAIDQILQNKEHTQTFSREGTLLTSIRLNRYGWILSVADSEKALFKDITNLTRLVELLIAVCGTLGILAAVFFSKRILFPIGLLRQMVNEIGKDNQTYLREASGDEVGEVQALLNDMKKKIQELNAKQYILEVREREAEIRMLQSQINPHFLHNTLDNIYCIAQIEEIEPIVVLTRNLSDMMRYSVNNKSMFVALEEEVNHVKSYLEILNVRYENRIRLEVDIPKELLKAQVVKLLLQPLAENACIHGILPKEGYQGTIWLQVMRKEEILEIQMEDDGVGLLEEVREQLNTMMKKQVRSVRTPKNKGFGIALVNVNDRTQLLDGPGFGIRLENRPNGGTKVIAVQKYRRETTT